MSDAKVRKWHSLFQEGRMKIHDEGYSSWFDWKSWKKFKKTGASPLMFSQSWIYKVLTEKLSYKKLCAGWVLKMVTDPHEKKKYFTAKSLIIHFTYLKAIIFFTLKSKILHPACIIKVWQW